MNAILSQTPSVQWKHDVILAPYSTYKIGGKAKLFCKVTTEAELVQAIHYCHLHQIDYYLLGRGSNTLFDDRGFDGAVIVNALSGFEHKEGLFKVLAGTSFSYLGIQSAKLGYSGLEYAAGIPGSVGGAIFMNAGANNQEIKDVIQTVKYLDQEVQLKELDRSQLRFGYRSSIFHQTKGVIVSAEFKLTKDPMVRQRQITMIEKRKATQPLSQPSCGCTFRNGENFITGKLIEDLGLKGLQIGGAQISTVHANFIVNVGNDKSADVKALICLIEEKVKEKTPYSLEREIRFVPYQQGVTDAL